MNVTNELKSRILVAGATGYLGRHLIEALQACDADFKAQARSADKLKDLGLNDSQIQIAQVTDSDSLKGCCDGVDIVISCVGITRQKEGLSYMDVDYQANLNLLEEAERAGVKKFVYVSAFRANVIKSVRLLEAKERFACRLLVSEQLAPCVVRPNGFFADIEEFYNMAQSGRVYLFGSGDVRLNPIHGADLADFILASLPNAEKELDVGGPDVLSATQIAALAFQSQGKMTRITYIPDCVRKLALSVIRRLPENRVGPAEFFLSAMEGDAIAPCVGKHHLSDYFSQLNKESNKG
ncbi:SDR family oxidoreductase [Vibrio splendidus]|uniref:SDR family oxidoreductase n=1 Tax=Vibrio splendidus TaxID=29497 RepID=UPI000C848FDD|nr:SDR family oxidoreductase [Vibrio splendidus]MBU2909190.1 SDR family oxidoreductase [Vibrio splendidus]MDO6531945.1 SDR family oxidoreductase [Vibrio splendidus]MDO6553065.1 SDR family oxidoreductase [Vibrio splendidus]PMO43535.1 NAD-dependent dehydratase [Vibrio splendidus]PTP44076.1 NAD-dependent dehydratase [Vibrio splendidus]